MLRQDYHCDGLALAYCCHVYLRWHTRRLRPCPPLERLDRATLQQLASGFDLHVLEGSGSGTEVRVLVSLKPSEAVSTCASKLKGQTSKWLREALGLREAAGLLARGYFACTSGKSTREQVEPYLQQQGEHHGYGGRVLPPVYVATFAPGDAAEARLAAEHACTVLNYHLVFATWRRRGLFGAEEGRAVAERWLQLQGTERFALRKVSFVPDHVHVAVRVHPGVAPDRLVVRLMNSAQEVIWTRFGAEAIRARLERLWQPSAYIGSFGDLASPQIQQYLRNWEAGGKR